MIAKKTETVSPFHKGEQFIQEKLGVREKMERFGRQVIRGFIPEQHRDFYQQLPFIFVGHADEDQWPWASILFNDAGFMASASNTTLNINTKPVIGDPLNNAIAVGNRLGLLGIELATRRRNRLAGHITQLTNTGFELTVDQAFGNCPQYIQAREYYQVDTNEMPKLEVIAIQNFDADALALIARSDTFFVASFVADGSNAAYEGVDVSHRGGKPGFIKVDNEYQLTIPDYLGNNHFNTLGNFIENPKAGLLFVDFEQGHLLTLTGRVEVLFDSDKAEYFKGAERLWTFRIEQGYWLKNTLPIRWKLHEYSPNTSLTGSWKEAAQAKKADELKNTWQAYQLIKIQKESQFISSFYLQAPEDQKPQFEAGQFLTIRVMIAGKQQLRTYTVSSSPADEYLRISVKNNGHVGSVSHYLHHHLILGEQLMAKAPCGQFTFNASGKRSVILISAGIGITPMISMLRHALQEGVRTRAMQTITLINAFRNAQQRAFYDELMALEESAPEYIRIISVLSQPEAHLSLGRDYHYQGRIDVKLLQSVVTSTENDVYLCGPAEFMQTQYALLRLMGIANDQIFAEAFGPSGLIRDEQQVVNYPVIAEQAIINFTESSIEQSWTKGDGTLLEFAEAHGLTPTYGCRSGQCGACKVKLIKGKVSYVTAIDYKVVGDEVLLCCAQPAKELKQLVTNLVIKL